MKVLNVIPGRTLGTALLAGMMMSSAALAGPLTVPNTFTANTPARAAEVNGNFDAVKTAVDDNDSRITTNSADIDAVEAVNATQDTRITAVEGVNTTQDGRLDSLEDEFGLSGRVTDLESEAVINGQDLRIVAGGSLQSTLDFNNGDVIPSGSPALFTMTKIGVGRVEVTFAEGLFGNFVPVVTTSAVTIFGVWVAVSPQTCADAAAGNTTFSSRVICLQIYNDDSDNSGDDVPVEGRFFFQAINARAP